MDRPASTRSPRRFRRLRIGLLAQIGLALAIVGTVPLAIAAAQLATVNREALVEQLLRTHTVSARTAADAIDSFLAARRSLASTLLLSPELAADPTSAVGQLRLSDSLASWSATGIVAAALYDASDQLIVKVQQKGYGELADDLLGGAAAAAGPTSATSATPQRRHPLRHCARSTFTRGSGSSCRSPADRAPPARCASRWTASRCCGPSPPRSSGSRRVCSCSIAQARPLLGSRGRDRRPAGGAPRVGALGATLRFGALPRPRRARDRRRLVGRRLRTMDRRLDAARRHRRGGGTANAAALRPRRRCSRSPSRR